MSTTTRRIAAKSSRALDSRANPVSDIAWGHLVLFLSLLAAILLFVLVTQAGAPPQDAATQSLARPTAVSSPLGQ